MSDNTLVFSLIVWVSLLTVLFAGNPDVFDLLLGNPVEVSCE